MTSGVGPDPFTLAALLVALDPHGLGGAVVEGPGGPAVDAWLHVVRSHRPPESPWRRIPAGITPDRLVGGLDLTRSLAAGRRVGQPGLLAEADGGIVLLPSAERLRVEVAAPLLEALDRGRMSVERDGVSECPAAAIGVVALDESVEDEPGAPAALRDRTAFLLPLPPRWKPTPEHLPGAAALARAREALPHISVTPEAMEALARQAAMGGWASHRPLLLALRTARALAALLERPRADAEIAALAGALVLVPRGAPLPATGEDEADPDAAHDEPPEPPAAEEEQDDAPEDAGDEASPDEPPPGEPPTPEADEAPDTPEEAPEPSGLPADLIPAVVRALLPKDWEDSKARPSGSGGRSLGRSGRGRGDGLVPATARGRRIGAEPGRPRGGRRLDLPATLVAAAPWQRLRSQARAREAEDALTGDSPALQVTPDDLRVQRRVRPAASRTLFLVDASGSQALRRLGEVKGAVELLLADSYRRRDEVALIVFRGRDARVVVPPTRSLVRARRLLRGLAGGGGTPLARGLETALELVHRARRDDVEPRIVLLSDGRPNVDRAGKGGRSQARNDALALADELRRTGTPVRVLDTSPRGERFLDELARHLGTRSHHLPHADARAIRRAAAPSPAA
ncbi:MAG: VWA domain-containing protein [Gemmatimonadales bacterium]|nr:MAG: VWA domain-containing protein [Gemmatimonadales bacterium]